MKKCLKIVTAVLLFYVFMLLFHEIGHVISVWFNGGTIEEFKLLPISHTISSGSSNPIMDLWAGPAIGVLLPGLYAVAAKAFLMNNSYLWAFFGFCLVANGSYFTIGLVDNVGDVGMLRYYGVDGLAIGSIGSVMLIAGLGVWHCQIESARNT